jgi:hypothetical protein
MALYGYTRLELAREKKVNNRIKREVVKRIEKHNDITPYVQNAITKGNFNMSIPNSSIMPLSQWFDGCMLTSAPNDPSLGMIAHNSDVVACAGNSSDYGSTDIRRGALNTTETADITGGRRFVWDWGTDRGNGIIASVGLTRSALAIAEISDTVAPSANPINPILATITTGGVNSIANMTIIDYEKSVGYLVSYSNGIVVTEYPLCTKAIKLFGSPYLKQIGYDGNVISTTHNIPNSTISNPSPNIGNTSISYTGSHIHWIIWSGATIKDYVINTTTWELDSSFGTGGIITRTFTGVTFANIRYYYIYNQHYKKDICPIIGDYVWCVGTVGGVMKMLKCNLLGSAATEIFEYDNLYSTILGISDASYCNGTAVVLPNGDFIKTPSIHADETGGRNALYYHNNKFYLARFNADENDSGYNSYRGIGIDANSYGTLLKRGFSGNDGAIVQFGFIHGFISTCNNLEEAVTKSADLTMKLTYEITEVLA